MLQFLCVILHASYHHAQFFSCNLPYLAPCLLKALHFHYMPRYWWYYDYVCRLCWWYGWILLQKKENKLFFNKLFLRRKKPLCDEMLNKVCTFDRDQLFKKLQRCLSMIWYAFGLSSSKQSKEDTKFRL